MPSPMADFINRDREGSTLIGGNTCASHITQEREVPDVGLKVWETMTGGSTALKHEIPFWLDFLELRQPVWFACFDWHQLDTPVCYPQVEMGCVCRVECGELDPAFCGEA